MKTYKLIGIQLLIASVQLLTNSAKSQNINYPETGKLLPDYTLTDVRNYPEKKLTLSKKKGKWLILDFWSSVCGGCIQSFPKMNKLAETFKDDVQIVMIGMCSATGEGATSEKKTKKLYNMLEEKNGLKFTVAFDTVLQRLYGVKTVPHILIVDPAGIVNVITTGIDEATVRGLLSGNSVSVRKSLNRSEALELEQNYNTSIPFLTSGKTSNGGNDTSFLFRSLLSKANRGITPYYKSVPFEMYPIGDKAMFEEYSISVINLYQLAYIGYSVPSLLREDERYGKDWPVPLIETNDSTKLKFITSDYVTGMGRFCYSLTVPIEKANTGLPISIMKQDLKNYFGLEGVIENRVMPIWKLVVIDNKRVERLRSNNASSNILINKSDSKFGGIDFIGATMEQVLDACRGPVQIGRKSENIFVNETNIPYKVDIKFKANLVDLEEVRAGLRKNGLDLVRGTKEMRVLILKDVIE
ncbi:TlpA disulfide reductase family protein [Pedobacter nyackensis]|uniref:TlpA family protein disulfide reductase n=1 Tax=Pedobacter nyackensis TaxID=475255 RepID=UPI00292E7CD2|nr:TlpA disulfide reductase family protein [Pedobacter nyackensis]